MMLEVTLIVLVLVCVAIVVLMAFWVNQQATALNALGARVQQLEQRSTARANDPVANFKTL